MFGSGINVNFSLYGRYNQWVKCSYPVCFDGGTDMYLSCYRGLSGGKMRVKNARTPTPKMA